MIPKGNQRAGGRQLATHLLNEFDNDSVEVAEVRGAVATDLHGAFAEWEAISLGTKCRKYLYSLSINPDHMQGPFSRAHYYDFIARTEDKLGLFNQPRAVVFHVKYGREHCHVVWARVDSDNLKAVHLPHDRQKLRAVAQEFARDHGITLPPGMRNNRGKDRFNDRAKVESLAEKQQEERTGATKLEHREAITQAWRESKDGQGLIRALEQRGYYLARGDERAYVVVDLAGEIHSLSRFIDGARAKDIRERLSGYKMEAMPDIARAREFARQQRESREKAAQKDAGRSTGTTAAKRQADFAAIQKRRRERIAKDRAALETKHRTEAESLRQMQRDEISGVKSERASRQPKGIAAFLTRITGIQAVIALKQKKQDRALTAEHYRQMRALARRHGREMAGFAHREHALASIEKREARSLKTLWRREHFRAIAGVAKTGPTPRELAAAKRAKTVKAKGLADAFRKAAGARQRESKRGGHGLTEQQQDKVTEFKQAGTDLTRPAPAGGKLSKAFNEKARKRQQVSAETTGGKKRITPQEIKENAADITKANKRADKKVDKARDLAKAFRERAGQTQPRNEREREGGDPGDTGSEKHYRRPPPDFSLRR